MIDPPLAPAVWVVAMLVDALLPMVAALALYDPVFGLPVTAVQAGAPEVNGAMVAPSKPVVLKYSLLTVRQVTA